MYASLSLSCMSGKTVGIRDMCVPTHAVLVVRASKGEILVMFGKRARTRWREEEGQPAARTVEGRGRVGEGGRPDLRCPRPP